MELKDALNEFGFKPDYRPTANEVKKEYRPLAQFFHPDRNPTEREVATEMMKILNESVEVIRDNFDTRNEWKIEDYIYKDVKTERLAQFGGYEGKIKLEGDGTIYRVNRGLHSTPGRFEGPHTIGSLVNEHRPYDWYIQFEGCRRYGWSSMWDELNAEFVVGLHDFLLKFYQDTEQEVPRELYAKAFGDNRDIYFELDDNEIEVSYEEFEEDEMGLIDKVAYFTMKDIRLIEKIAFEKMLSEEHLENNNQKTLQ